MTTTKLCMPHRCAALSLIFNEVSDGLVKLPQAGNVSKHFWLKELKMAT